MRCLYLKSPDVYLCFVRSCVNLASLTDSAIIGDLTTGGGRKVAVEAGRPRDPCHGDRLDCGPRGRQKGQRGHPGDAAAGRRGPPRQGRAQRIREEPRIGGRDQRQGNPGTARQTSLGCWSNRFATSAGSWKSKIFTKGGAFHTYYLRIWTNIGMFLFLFSNSNRQIV